MDGQRFDDLTRLMATSTSRRQVLKALGVSLAGAFAALVPSRVVADQPEGNDDCAHFCRAVFPPGEERGVCTSTAARAVPDNLCAQCGADATRLCPGETTTRCCPPGKVCCGATACCEPGQHCCPAQDKCVTCPPGTTFNATTCACEGGCANPRRCGSVCGPRCLCVPTAEGGSICSKEATCPSGTCASSADCDDGEFCARTCCPQELICVRPCGTPVLTAAEASGDGPRSTEP